MSDVSDRVWFLILAAIIGMSLYLLMIIGFSKGNPWMAAGAVLLASPVAMLVLAANEPNRGATVFARLANLVDFRHGSWAFLIGDVFLLSTMAAVIAVGWRRVDKASWFGSSWQWLLIALAVGVIAGLVFHHNEVGVFSTEALNSPTKLWHDLVTYPVLCGGLVFGLVPMARQTPWVWIALALFALWLLAGVADSTWHKLNPGDLHKPFIWPTWTR